MTVTEHAPSDEAGVSGTGRLQTVLLFLALGGALLAGLFWVSRVNFLLFHGLAELFSIAVAFSVFLLVWNAREFIRNDALLFLGIAYLFVGFIDLLHTLAYKGMGVFPDTADANPATQLWIAGRSLETLSLLLFPLLLGRRVRPWPVFGAFAAVTALLLAAVFAWRVFPDCYVEGAGLTAFKKGAEYTLSLALVAAIALLVRKRKHLDGAVYRLMVAAISVTIAAELAFTFYVGLHGLLNVAGHYLKVVSFFLVYMALIRSGLTRPYATLFRELQQEKAVLDSKVAELNRAFDQIKTLRGIVPICMTCKKIRDDRGYWNQVEVYVRDHTEAEFSHGMCPECMRKMYPDFEMGADAEQARPGETQ